MSKTISPEDWFSLTHAEQECMFKAHAESLPSNEIDKDYIFMSNIYGHEIEGPYEEEEEKDVEKLEKTIRQSCNSRLWMGCEVRVH